MVSTARLIEPASTHVYAANDNIPRAHRSSILDRAKSGRLFNSPEENLVAIRTIHRMDNLLSSAESDPTYAKVEEGQFNGPSGDDEGDDIGGPAIIEVAGRSAERVIEDFHNGPVVFHTDVPTSKHATPYIHGRFKFNEFGIITGYRLNREKWADDRDIWVSKASPKFPDNKATPRDIATKDHRGVQPGKTSAFDVITPANDNMDARFCVTWVKARMAPEYYEALYDVTAGLGFNQIGTDAGFSGKQADAVGKDRVICGLRQAARVLAEWDDQQ